MKKIISTLALAAVLASGVAFANEHEGDGAATKEEGTAETTAAPSKKDVKAAAKKAATKKVAKKKTEAQKTH